MRSAGLVELLNKFPLERVVNLAVAGAFLNSVHTTRFAALKPSVIAFDHLVCLEMNR